MQTALTSKINYLGRINEYNNIIDEFNKNNGFERVIGFHLEGCRGGRKRRGSGGQPGAFSIVSTRGGK